MPTNIFTGYSQPVKKVKTFTIGGTITAADTVTMTINLKEITYTLTGSEADTDEVAAALYALLIASTLDEFREISWTIDGSVISGESVTAGTDWTAVGSESGTLTISNTDVTAAKGPYHWSDPDNWSLAAVPVTGDDVIIPKGSPPIKYGLSYGSVNLASLTIYSDSIGLPDMNGNYHEYRDRYLKIQCASVRIASTGTGLIRLDFNNGGTSGAVTVNVETAPNPSVNGEPSVHIINTPASSVLNCAKGYVGLAVGASEVTTFGTINMAYKDQPFSDANVIGGAGLGTVATVKMVGGNLNLRTAVTTLTIRDGVATVEASITTVNGLRGQLIWNGTGTVTTMNVGAEFVLDLSRDLRSRTITNCTVDDGGGIKNRPRAVTFTNPISIRGGLRSDRIDFGSGFTLVVA